MYRSIMFIECDASCFNCQGQGAKKCTACYPGFYVNEGECLGKLKHD